MTTQKNKVTISAFLDWYFSDTRDAWAFQDIGYAVKQSLRGNGSYSTSVYKLFFDCGYIPQFICEDKLGDAEYDPFEVMLVNDLVINQANQKNNDPYGVFCVASHQYLSHIHELDLRWERAVVIYQEFCESDYNVATKSELDCINEYMDFFYSNKKKYHNTNCEMHTIADLKEAIKNLDDNDILVMETIDTETGDAIDLYPFYIDVIEGIKLNDGTMVREVRVCQLDNK